MELVSWDPPDRLMPWPVSPTCKDKSYLTVVVWMACVYRLEWGCGCWLTGGLGGSGWADFRALFSQLVGKGGSVCIGLLPVASVEKGDRITTVRTQVALGSSPRLVAFSTATSGVFSAISASDSHLQHGKNDSVFPAESCPH